MLGTTYIRALQLNYLFLHVMRLCAVFITYITYYIKYILCSASDGLDLMTKTNKRKHSSKDNKCLDGI